MATTEANTSRTTSNLFMVLDYHLTHDVYNIGDQHKQRISLICCLWLTYHEPTIRKIRPLDEEYIKGDPLRRCNYIGISAMIVISTSIIQFCFSNTINTYVY